MLIRKNLRARTVTIKVRYADFTTVTRNHTAEVPTCDEHEIVVRALALLDRTEAGRRPVRLLGVGAHGLVDLTDSIPPSELFPFSP
jgi:DNA polymerase-4